VMANSLATPVRTKGVTATTKNKMLANNMPWG
jgi:hypothetical protein